MTATIRAGSLMATVAWVALLSGCMPDAGPEARADESAGSGPAAAAATPGADVGKGLREHEVDAMTEDRLEKATFAGGCFWCMEPPYDEIEGVVSTTSGYTGGHVQNPTYEQVSAGGTGHAEAVEIRYDPEMVTYGELLHVFWRNIDPLAKDRQFCDRGHQYRSAIFYHDEEQRRLAETSKRELEESGRFDGPIVTEIEPAGPFYEAEEYHQDYYRKNPIRYKFYRWNCGRDARLRELWGDEAA